MTASDSNGLVATAVLVHLRHICDSQMFAASRDELKSKQAAEYVCVLGHEEFAVSVLSYSDGTADLQIRVKGGKEHRGVFTCDYAPGKSLINTAVEGRDECHRSISQLVQRDLNKYRIIFSADEHDVIVRSRREHELNSIMPVQVESASDNMLISPMPGKVFSMNLKEGDQVSEGDEACIVEAMKMQNILKAPKSG